MGLRVGMTYDVKSQLPLRPGDPPDLNAEFDADETISVIEEAIRGGGHETVRIGSARQLLERLHTRDAVDIVFNIAEGLEGRNRESQVPILLEMLRVPYVGADGLTLGLTLDKVLTKKVLIAEGIPTPRFVEVQDPEQPWQADLHFPLIVKLRHEGSSKGLNDRSLVDTMDELQRQVRWLITTYKQPSLFVEEFIEGEEFTVALIGNEPPEVYPVVQITLDGETDLGRKFYTFAYLRAGADYLCPAPIDAALAQRLQELALRTYRLVECRDFGRVDFRVDRQGRPYVLEINPLPSLSTADVFPRVAQAKGMTYPQIINRILDAALIRHRLNAPTEASPRSLTPSPSPIT